AASTSCLNEVTTIQITGNTNSSAMTHVSAVSAPRPSRFVLAAMSLHPAGDVEGPEHQPQRERRHDQRHDHHDDTHRGRLADVETLERTLVDVVRQVGARRTGTTLGHEVDRVETVDDVDR